MELELLFCVLQSMLSSGITRMMEKQGVQFYSGQTLKSIEKDTNGTHTVQLNDGKSIKSQDRVIIATGRHPGEFDRGSSCSKIRQEMIICSM